MAARWALQNAVNFQIGNDSLKVTVEEIKRRARDRI